LGAFAVIGPVELVQRTCVDGGGGVGGIVGEQIAHRGLAIVVGGVVEEGDGLGFDDSHLGG